MCVIAPVASAHSVKLNGTRNRLIQEAQGTDPAKSNDNRTPDEGRLPVIFPAPGVRTGGLPPSGEPAGIARGARSSSGAATRPGQGTRPGRVHHAGPGHRVRTSGQRTRTLPLQASAHWPRRAYVPNRFRQDYRHVSTKIRAGILAFTSLPRRKRQTPRIYDLEIGHHG
jgi:hypothetical protein